MLGLLIGNVADASAKVANTTLGYLAKHADAIVLAKVDTVGLFNHVRLARATVVRSLKGLPAGQSFAFLAEPTWICDASTSTAGETVFLFLEKHRADRPGMRGLRGLHSSAEIEKSGRLAGLNLYTIAYSGRGRLSLLSIHGNDYLSVWQKTTDRGKPAWWTGPSRWISEVRLPSELQPKPNFRRDRGWLVEFDVVEQAINKLLNKQT